MNLKTEKLNKMESERSFPMQKKVQLNLSNPNILKFSYIDKSSSIYDIASDYGIVTSKQIDRTIEKSKKYIKIKK